MKLSTNKIIAQNDGSVGRIILNNPERRNAISLEMWQGIAEAFQVFSDNPETRCIVMSGAGDKAFASGADIVTMPTKVFDGMYEHVLTDKGMDIFDKDYAKSIEGLEIKVL